jgi:PAS domain-containing protein
MTHVVSQSNMDGAGNDLSAETRTDAQLRRTIDAIPVLAWCNRPDGSNEFLNKRWQDYTGLSPEEAEDSQY